MAWTNRFTDSFTGTEGTELSVHGATWVKRQSADAYINASNQLKIDSGSGFTIYSNSTSLADDQAVEADYHNTSDFNGVIARHSHIGTPDNFNGYCLFVRQGTAYIYERNGTSWSLLDSNSVSWSAGDTGRIEVSGTSITTFKNGSSAGMPSATDATISSGDAAFRCITNVDPAFDNFKSDDEGGGGAFRPYWALNRSSIINSGIS